MMSRRHDEHAKTYVQNTSTAADAHVARPCGVISWVLVVRVGSSRNSLTCRATRREELLPSNSEHVGEEVRAHPVGVPRLLYLWVGGWQSS